MFEKKFCIECGKPKKIVRHECKKCKRIVCWDCTVTLEDGSRDYCIFCAEGIIHNRVKKIAHKKAICLHCGERMKEVRFTHCPYCGMKLKTEEKNAI